MARRSHRRRRSRSRRSIRPSVSIAGYTRVIGLQGTPAASFATSLVTQDIPDVLTPPEETVNRKIIGVHGQGMFVAALSSGKHVEAQFCLWAHPQHEDWPSIADYDPFNQGPGEAGFKGMLAPRPFCRRTWILVAPNGTSSVQATVQSHTVKSRAERLLRPGWKLTAGLYLRGDTVQCDWRGLIRVSVAG